MNSGEQQHTKQSSSARPGRIISAGVGLRIPLEVRNAKEEAREILKQARAHADSIGQEARRVAQLREEKMDLEIERAVEEKAQEMLADLVKWKKDLSDELEQKVLQVALAMGTQLARKELCVNPERMRAVAKESLQTLRGATWVRLRVHPAQLETFADIELDVVADESLEPGDLVAESDVGKVDRRLTVVAKKLIS